MTDDIKTKYALIGYTTIGSIGFIINLLYIFNLLTLH
jgi:preprotein translocase subunit Sss1